MRWIIGWCDFYEGAKKLEELLKDGWEPFAVTEISQHYRIWLRKQVEA